MALCSMLQRLACSLRPGWVSMLTGCSITTLQPADDAAATLAAALPGLEAADWLEAVKALNLLRQLAVHHPDTCSAQL